MKKVMGNYGPIFVVYTNENDRGHLGLSQRLGSATGTIEKFADINGIVFHGILELEGTWEGVRK